MIGKSAHASTPELGINGAVYMCHYLSTISQNQLVQFIDQYFYNDCYGEKLGIAYTGLMGPLTCLLYTSVYVTEKPTQFVKLGDQNLGILNDLSKPDVQKGFEKSTIKIDNKDVTALQNKDMGLTLLYLQNEDDSTGFYIYDVDNNKVLSKYQTVAVNGKTYVLMDAPDNLEAIQDLKTATIKIGDVELNGWKFEDEALSHYTLCLLYTSSWQEVWKFLLLLLVKQ